MFYDEAVVKKLAALLAVLIKDELLKGGWPKLPPRCLTVPQCAEWLGLTEQAIEKRLQRDPEFRACTVSGFGTRVLFCVKKLEDYLRRHGV